MIDKEKNLAFGVTPPKNWERDYFVGTPWFAEEIWMVFDCFRHYTCESEKEKFEILKYYKSIEDTVLFSEKIVEVIENWWSLPN